MALELLEMAKRDMGGMTDTDLERLLEETRQESSRRGKLNPNSALMLRSRWVASFFLLAVAFFVLFKAETSGMDKDDNGVDSKIMAKPGEKGAWLMDTSDKMEKKKVDGEETDAKAKAEEIEKELEQRKNPAVTEADDSETAKEEETKSGEDETKEEDSKETTTEAETKTAAEETKVEETPETSATATEGSGATSALGATPRASEEAKIAALKEGTRPKIKYHYKPRATIDNNPAKAGERDTVKKELAAKWGSWTLVDPKAADRPKDDFAREYPSRDIPWDKFPTNAWQVDQEYLAKFLPEAKAHVERSIEAMLAEYGWSKFDLPDMSLEERIDGKDGKPHSFKIEYLNLTSDDVRAGKGHKGQNLGGWVTQQYFDGLVRRLMHAILTDDTFTLVMGGHSASAGHGNHFQQSYTLQFHKVIEPVLARLGVKLSSHNVGYGGLGTLQTSMGAGDLYGREIDILVWDSEMTEKSNAAYDFYVRQAFLSGNRIPVLMGGMRDQLVRLDNDIDAEVGNFGTGVDGVPEITDGSMAESVIWMARYLRCSGETHALCREREYNGTCWIERDDYTPETKQQPEPGGRASWHPGFRQHGIRGRIIGITVLRALLEGLKQWDEAPDKKLPEEVWHVNAHYENIRKKLKDLPEEAGECFKWNEIGPKSILCTTPFRGASEMTPRVFPHDTAIRNIMKPALNGRLPEPPEPVYSPPDLFNPNMETPDGEFDYNAVVENGVDYPEFLAFDNSPLPPLAQKTDNKLIPLGVDTIKPGLGWGLDTPANPDGCDGSYDGFCNRGVGNNCLLYGHNDHRGGLFFDSFSGWGVFTAPGVKAGVIIIRLEWWHKGQENTATQGWTEENNGDEAYARRLASNTTKTEQLRRRLKGEELCNEGKFEVAVNGNIKAYTKEEFMKDLQIFERVVQVITVLNDPSVTNAQATDIEFAVRFTGCGHKNLFSLSSVYWA